MHIESALVGGVMNRIRGGWILPKYNRTANVLAFGILFGVHTNSTFLAACFALAMLAGQSLGWGRYIGALGGWEDKKLEEVKVIDFLIQQAKPYKRLWGFLGLTLRGCLWGACLSIPALSYVPLVVGSLMGVCYGLSLLAFDKKGWEVGEIFFGSLLWFSVSFSLTN